MSYGNKKLSPPLKTVSIDYSYFIRTDEEGKIISSDPDLGEKCNV